MAGFALDSEVLDPIVNIKVVGVGGGGGNALNCMVNAGIKDIEYISVNTDAAALRSSKATVKIQIGAKLTRGRGAGNKPEIGERSAQENRDEIAEILENATSQIFSFSGHYHMEDMRSEGNITQVLTPAVSYQILKNQTD